MRLAIFALLVVGCGRPPAAAPRPRIEACSSMNAPPLPAAPLVRGWLFDANGKPLAVAHARALGADGKAFEEVSTNSDGSFALSLAQREERILRLEYTSPGLRTETVLVVREETPLELTVRLAADATQPALVVFSDPASATAGLRDLANRVELSRREGVIDDLRVALADLAAHHRQVIVRQAAAAAYFQDGSFPVPTEAERARARTLLENVPAGDAIWAFWPSREIAVAVRGR